MSPGSKGNEAVQELFGRCADGLYRFAYEFLGTEQEAEDVVQESFLVALRHGPVMGRLNNPRAWLFTVALNLCRQRYKRTFRDRAAKRDLGIDPRSKEHTRTSGSGSPGERMALHEAIQTLAPDHRAVLLLGAHEGFTASEIASLLGIPEGTVWSRLFHSRKLLAQALGLVGE